MTPIDAYQFTLEKVEELKNEGITVKTKVAHSANDISMIKEYKNNSSGIPNNKWIKVKFCNVNEWQLDKIFQTVKYLCMCGIYFDIGGDKNSFDWELDWSFNSTGQENEEWVNAIYTCEDSIKELRQNNK